MNPLADFSGTIIKKSHHNVRKRLIVVNFPGDLLGRVSGSDNKQSLATLSAVHGGCPKKPPAPNILIIEPEADPESGNEEKSEQGIKHKNSLGKSVKTIPQQDNAHTDKTGNQASIEKIQQIGQRSIPPHAAIKAKKRKKPHLDREKKNEDRGDIAPLLKGNGIFKPDEISQQMRGYKQ